MRKKTDELCKNLLKKFEELKEAHREEETNKKDSASLQPVRFRQILSGEEK